MIGIQRFYQPPSTRYVGISANDLQGEHRDCTTDTRISGQNSATSEAFHAISARKARQIRTLNIALPLTLSPRRRPGPNFRKSSKHWPYWTSACAAGDRYFRFLEVPYHADALDKIPAHQRMAVLVVRSDAGHARHTDARKKLRRQASGPGSWAEYIRRRGTAFPRSSCHR